MVPFVACPNAERLEISIRAGIIRENLTADLRVLPRCTVFMNGLLFVLNNLMPGE
jgi:hypothetical protein